MTMRFSWHSIRSNVKIYSALHRVPNKLSFKEEGSKRAWGSHGGIYSTAAIVGGIYGT